MHASERPGARSCNKMNEKNLLFEVIRKFSSPEIDLSLDNIDNVQMGYILGELIRIGAIGILANMSLPGPWRRLKPISVG